MIGYLQVETPEAAGRVDVSEQTLPKKATLPLVLAVFLPFSSRFPPLELENENRPFSSRFPVFFLLQSKQRKSVFQFPATV
jgi:hypothetical protein